MSKELNKNLFFLFKGLSLKDKENFFWDCYKILGNEKLMFDSFTREEIKERFDRDLTEEEYLYLKKNIDTYSWMIGNCIDVIIDDLLYEKNSDKN